MNSATMAEQPTAHLPGLSSTLQVPPRTHLHRPLSPPHIGPEKHTIGRNPTASQHVPPPEGLTAVDSTSTTMDDDAADRLDPHMVRSPGAEPGIDVRRASAIRAYRHISEECEIEVIDYSSERIKFRQFKNRSFLEFLHSKDGTREPDMEVRWINVAGVSWDVISALALKYELHPLSIEDVFHSRSNSRSKADYYGSHLFIRVLTNATTSKKASPLQDKYLRDDANATVSSESESETEEELTDEEDEEAFDQSSSALRRVKTRRRRRRPPTLESFKPRNPLRWMEAAPLLSPEGRKRSQQVAKLEALKKRDRVRIIVGNVFLFLFKDGTVISIHSGDRAFGNPIYQRLRHPDSVLRRDPDASLLIHALLDLIVDQALQVVDKYSDKINDMETSILLKPNMDVVRRLHIVSADLSNRKRDMLPTKRLIYALRRFDAERTAAVMGQTPSSDYQGYMSHKTKVYMADVYDHLESILSSLDQYSTMVDNLIDFAFNMSSHNMNTAMARMTLLTAIFLPLTFLTGYFGQNFKPFPAVDNYSDILFWEISIPVMVVLLPLAFWDDILKILRYIGKVRTLVHVERKQTTRVRKAKRQQHQLSQKARGSVEANREPAK